jgi:hypothetical protein
MMRILSLCQGPYGERIHRNVRQKASAGWSVDALALPKVMPPLVDDPDDFLPAAVPGADLLLAVGESAGAAQLIPDIAARSGAEAVIAPIDNGAWLPVGLARQLKGELAQMGTAAVFPRPFCSLTESSYGYGNSAERYEHPTIAAFAKSFGRPALAIDVNPATNLIRHVDVERDSACGSAYHVAEGLVNMSADEASIKAGLILHHYPCLCSMNQEWIDDRLYDTLMHVSGYIVNREVAERLRPYLTPPQHLTPPGYVE